MNLKQEITKVVQDFLRVEGGNRITPYNMDGFLGRLLRTIEASEKDKQDGNSQDKDQ